MDFAASILRFIETVKFEFNSNSKFAGSATCVSFRMGIMTHGTERLTQGGNLILVGKSFLSNTGGLSHVDLEMCEYLCVVDLKNYPNNGSDNEPTETASVVPALLKNTSTFPS